MAAGNRKWEAVRHYKYEQNAAIMRNEIPPTEEEWKEQVIEQTELEYLHAELVIVMFHDKDWELDDNGAIQPKGLHAHIIVWFDETTARSNATRKLRVSSDKNLFPITGKNKSNDTYRFRYSCHLNPEDIEAGKHVYNPDDVLLRCAEGIDVTYRDLIANKCNYNKLKGKESVADAHLSVLLKVCAGEWTAADAREYYATDPDKLGFDYSTWQSQKRKVLDAVDDYLDNERKFYIDEQNPRCLVHTYIEGEGGSGKDTVSDFLAGHYADHRGIHKVGANGKKKTFDPAGQYEGQNVSVFTEVSGKSFSINEFCSIFDPIRANSVNSRNNDKYWFARYAFMSNSIPLERFIWDLYEEEAREHLHKDGKDLNNNKDWKEHLESDQNFADKIRQIRRRFAVWVRIEKGSAYFYRRNNAVNTPTCHLDYLSYGKEHLWQNQLAYSACDKYKADHKSCKQCEHFVPNKQSSGSCSKLLPWEWVYVGECNIKDEQSIIELHEQAVREYFEQDPDYFTVTPWNTPTWRDVQKVNDIANSNNDTK